ncbi:MAG: hypothetical protein ACLP1Y_09905 [Candidatus Acidiferrales bacterium]
MLIRKLFCLVALIVFGLAAVPAALVAQGDTGQTQPVSVLVTVASKGKTPPPDVPQDAVVVHQDGQTRRVLDWQPLSQGGSSLDLVVYVDDSLDHSVGVALMDAAAFIRALPPNTRVEVAYSLSGQPQIGQAFTTDHEAAVKALHIPLGRSTGSYGLFTGLSEFVQGWPEGATRREILVISDGIDLMRGFSQALPGENQDLESLTNLLRREGIAVFTIFANGGSAELHSEEMVTVGQSCLQYLSDETGGEAFLSVSTAPSFTPYLDQLSQELAHQYLLTFAAVTTSKPKLSKLQVGAEVRGIVIYAPAHVNVPPSPAAH